MTTLVSLPSCPPPFQTRQSSEPRDVPAPLQSEPQVEEVLDVTPPQAPPQLIASLSQVGPPPQCPEILRRKARTFDSSSVSTKAYCEAINDCEDGQFTSCENLSDRHYYKDSASGDPSPQVMKAIVKEIKKDLPKHIELDPSASMFLRFDEEKPQFLQACLTGVKGTPYESGCFIFDIFIPDSYPHTNCLVTHTTRNANLVTANNGPGGFSPNLHRDSGKVCLSLLGTWDGPGWEPGKSNVYQVLSSILWMILGAEHPYYMEPSFGGWEGTAPSTNHEPDVIEYDEEVYFGTTKWAILEILKTPPPGFEEVVVAHFKAKKNEIVQTVQGWIDNGSPQLKGKLTPVLEELKGVLKGLMTLPEAEKEVEILNMQVAFIEDKMEYLKMKINACVESGFDPKDKIPRAYRRFKMGPKLLEQTRCALENAKQMVKDLAPTD